MLYSVSHALVWVLQPGIFSGVPTQRSEMCNNTPHVRRRLKESLDEEKLIVKKISDRKEVLLQIVLIHILTRYCVGEKILQPLI